MTKKIEDQIATLSPQAKKLFLRKAKEAISTNIKHNASSKKRIVAYVKGNTNFSEDILKADLKSKLPDYMVPSQFILVENMPLLPNGKIDRNTLQKTVVSSQKPSPKTIETKTDTNSIEAKLIAIWEEVLGFSPIHKDDNFFEIGGDSILSIQIIAKARKEGITLAPNALFEQQTIAELALFAETATTDVSNTTTIEENLTAIWEEVLGFSPIHKDDNFFEIGGDSILSIQIIAKARKKGVILPPNALFEHQTIAELALFTKVATQSTPSKISTGKVPLLPIQHWFFEDHKNAPQYWNQGVKLDNIGQISEEKLQKVCNFITTQHDALRARFFLEDDSWVQEIIAPTEINALEYVNLTAFPVENHNNIIAEHILKIQQNFTLTKGNLFKCIYFETGVKNTNSCILIAHHLVIDAVSWQIITDDFSTAIHQISSTNTIREEAKTTSLQEWSTYVNAYADTMDEAELSFWKTQIASITKLPFDITDDTIIEEQDIVQRNFTLNKNTTTNLIEANNAYNTKVDELLISAFVNTITNWTSFNEVTLGFEKHGRETTKTQLNLSKTVGWLTAYFPVHFSQSPEADLKEKIIGAKEKMRSIPNGGIGYGVLRYLKKTFGVIENPDIVFNFLGNKTTSTCKNEITVTSLTESLRDPKTERHYKLEINVLIVDNVLQGTLSYSKNVYLTATIDKLLNDFINQIEAIIQHCNQTETGGYTPSDFSETDISQDDLDNLLDLLE